MDREQETFMIQKYFDYSSSRERESKYKIKVSTKSLKKG